MVNREHAYQTIYGGCVTILSCAIIVLFIIIQSVYMSILATSGGELVTKLMPVTDDITTNKFYVSGGQIQPKTKTFNVAFGLSDKHDDPEIVEDADMGLLLPYLVTRE